MPGSGSFPVGICHFFLRIRHFRIQQSFCGSRYQFKFRYLDPRISSFQGSDISGSSTFLFRTSNFSGPDNSFLVGPASFSYGSEYSINNSNIQIRRRTSFRANQHFQGWQSFLMGLNSFKGPDKFPDPAIFLRDLQHFGSHKRILRIQISTF